MSLFSITCVGCMRPLCDSISLCCGHNVCRSCVAASASAAHIMGMSKPSPDRSPEKVTVSVQCPLNCTITSNVTWSGSPSALEGEISENQTLNTFVNKQLSEMAQSILCACRIKCRKHPAQATTECTDCHDMLFCGACFQQQHDDLPKMHQSSPLDTHKEILFSAAPYCAQHPKVESSLYCKDCETAVCPTCKFCIHQEHTCVSLKDLLRDTEEEISQYIFRFKSIMKLEANALTTVDLQKMRIIKAIDAGTRVLRHSLEEMKTLIEERISWINAHGEELKRTAVSRLNLQHHSIEQVLNKQQTVASLASKSLKSKNPTARRDTQKKLETVFSESLLLKKHLEPCEKSSNISINADDTNAIKYFISHFGSIQLNSTPIVKASPVEPVSSQLSTASCLGTCDTNKLSNATTSVPAVPSAVQTTHIPDTSQAVRDKLACDTSSRDIPALHLCKITASTFAGIGTQGFLDGSAQAAQFKFPCNLVIDSQRSLIVADQNNHRIRKISPEGIVTTLAGYGTPGYRDGDCNSAQFSYPYGVAMDAQGNIIVGDQCNHRIRKITKEGVTTVSGSSTGFVDGNAVSALFRNPVGIALGRSGEIWVADFGNHRIRKISATGLVSTVVGTGSAGYTDGLATQAQLYRPLAICVDNDGNLLVGHAGCIRKISSDGVVTTIAGTSSLGFSDGDGPAAQFGSFISSITVDRQNNLIVTDRDNHALRLVTPQGSVKTIYGRRPGSTKDDEESQFSPGGAAIDPVTGDMFVTDSNHHTIKRLHFSLP